MKYKIEVMREVVSSETTVVVVNASDYGIAENIAIDLASKRSNLYWVPVSLPEIQLFAESISDCSNCEDFNHHHSEAASKLASTSSCICCNCGATTIAEARR